MAAVMASSVLFFAGPTSGRTWPRSASGGRVACRDGLSSCRGLASVVAIRLALGERPQVATVGGLLVGGQPVPPR